MFLLWFDGLVCVLSAELGGGEGVAGVGVDGWALTWKEGMGWEGSGGYGLGKRKRGG